LKKDPKLVGSILQRATAATNSFVPDELRVKENEKLFSLTFNSLKNSTQSDFNIIWANSAIGFAKKKELVMELLMILNKNNGKINETFSLDQGMRWRIIQQAISWNIENAEEYLEKEKERDKSDRGDRAVRTAMSSYWDSKVKESSWKKYLDPNSLKGISNWQISADMAGFRWEHQHEIIKDYNLKFFENIKKIFKEREKEFSNSFFSNLFPFLPEDPLILSEVEKLLMELKSDEVVLQRNLKEEFDDLKRAQRCRNLVLKG